MDVGRERTRGRAFGVQESSRRHGYPCSRALLPVGRFASLQVQARLLQRHSRKRPKKPASHGCSRSRACMRSGPAAHRSTSRVSSESIEVTGTVFGSVVLNPVATRYLDDGTVEFVNAPESTGTVGTELLVRYRREGFVALATHAWTRSTEFDVNESVRRAVPLTPSNSASMNAMWEGEDWGRFGIEMYFIGEQPLEENPYRQTGRPHLLIGALAERRFGGIRVFINAENLLDVRQTKFDPLVLPSPRPDGRWTVDAWAPLDGLVVNGGIRVTF